MAGRDQQTNGVARWCPNDGWTPGWRSWFAGSNGNRDRDRRRTRLIEHTVRDALSCLTIPEREVVEQYYYNGLSFIRIADAQGLAVERVQFLHRRALANLRIKLAPFVGITFGLSPLANIDCPICCAPWRQTAEELLDEKTTAATWGEIARRLERAVGWFASTPQILMAHQKKHRRFDLQPPVEVLQIGDIDINKEDE